MVADGSISLSDDYIPSVDVENVNPDISKPVEEESKPKLTKLQQKLLELKKPLNLSAAPEIVLDPESVEKDEPVVDKATKFLMERIGIGKPPPMPVKSPKLFTTPPNNLAKYRRRKQEMSKKMLQKAREEQAKRYQVYKADNEMMDEEDDEEFEVSDYEEDGKDKEPKKKIVINEDEEVTEASSEEDILGEEETDDDDEAEEKPMSEFIDDEASEEEEEDADKCTDVDDEEYEGRNATRTREKSVVIFEDDSFNDVQEAPVQDAPSPAGSVHDPREVPDQDNEEMEQDEMPEQDDQQVPTSGNYLTVTLPDCPTQMIEPHLVPKIPIEATQSQHSVFIGSQTDKDELLDLCSGVFGSQKSDMTSLSKFNPMDYLSDVTDSTPDPILPQTTVRLVNSFDDTMDEVNRFMDAFNNAEDSYHGPPDSDSDIEDNRKPMKRKIVNYSDDEDSGKLAEPAKRLKLFSDDEGSDGDDGDDVSVTEKSIVIQPQKKNLLDFDDDFITTEDPSDAPAAEVVNIERPDSRKWIESDEEKGVNEEEDEKDARFLEDEAELSGDDVGSDDEENDDEDEYEQEECDKEVYDEEELRTDLAQQLNKQIQDDEYRRLVRLQEMLIGDDLQADSVDRSFRFRRLKEEVSDEDWQKLVAMNPVLAKMNTEEEDEDDDDELKKKSIEIQKWRLKESAKKEEKQNGDLDLMDDFGDSPLLMVGRQVMTKSTTHTIRKTMTSRDSLLGKSGNLELIVKENNSTEVKTHALFTIIPKNEQ